MCSTIQLDEIRVIQDVETRWGSTFVFIFALLYLDAAIKLHDELDRAAALLSTTDWAILRLLNPAIDPFMKVN